ncbi:MAG: FkbM family methyltransferase, partial [Cyanobacteria bacterium P01_D01_bin.73]
TTARLDTTLGKVGLQPSQLDVLVIDVQGAEILCLEGAGAYLGSVKFLELEVSQEEIYEGGALFRDVDKWVRSQGFVRVSIVPWHGNCVYRRLDTTQANFNAIDISEGPKRFASLGDFSPEEFHGQCGQDYWIYKKYFNNKPNGTFVDVGANDGVNLSSSYFFEKYMEWDGLCIEPNYQCLPSLHENRSCTILPCAAGERVAIPRMQAITGDLSVLSVLSQHCDPRHQYRMEQEAASEREKIFKFDVLQLPLSFILEAKQIANIDYLKIDVEGAELSVLKSLDWDRTSALVIEIEDNFGDAKTHDFLKSRGYVLDSVFDGFVYIYVSRKLYRPS